MRTCLSQAVLFFVMAGMVVLLEQILTEVACKVAPHRVDMVGVVLGIV